MKKTHSQIFLHKTNTHHKNQDASLYSTNNQTILKKYENNFLKMLTFTGNKKI